MALRNQPYLPLYVQDYLTDENLNMCSLSTQGVYIKLMCILHKQKEYGVILLKQKDKQSESTYLNFAKKIAKLLPINSHNLEIAIEELIDEDVLSIEGDKLFQKRMVKDNTTSEARSKAGKKGGEKTQSKKDFALANNEANSENEYEDESEVVIKDKKEDKIPYENFIKNFNEITGKRIRIPDDKFKRQFKARLKEGFTMKEILQAVENCSKDDYHKEHTKYLTPEFITRADKLQKFLNNGNNQGINEKRIKRDEWNIL